MWKKVLTLKLSLGDCIFNITITHTSSFRQLFFLKFCVLFWWCYVETKWLPSYKYSTEKSRNVINSRISSFPKMMKCSPHPYRFPPSPRSTDLPAFSSIHVGSLLEVKDFWREILWVKISWGKQALFNIFITEHMLAKSTHK